MNIFTGSDEWGNKEWVRNFYPAGNKGQSLLKYYGETFNFIELRSSYHYYDAEQIKKWISSVEVKFFRFCPWIPKIFLYQKDPHIEVEGVTEFLTNWDDCSDKLGPAVFNINQKYTDARKDRLFTLMEILPKSHQYVLNVFDRTWQGLEIMDELFDHANKNSIGIILDDNAYFKKTKASFLYLKIDIDTYPDMEKLLANIPTHLESVYICLTGIHKLRLWRKLKELQEMQASK